MDIIISHDPSNYLYYVPVIIAIMSVSGVFQLIIMYLQDSNTDQNLSLNYSLEVGEYSYTMIQKKNNLKFRYIFAYLLTRASVWSKSPYIWSMYLFYHKFTIPEIGILYVIDAVSALIFGPITGNLADMFGRKRFCQFYNITTILNLALRLTGDQKLAYLAQVLTGVGAGLITTSFESWVVSESIKEFKTLEMEREKFLKKLFKTVNMYDAGISIVCSVLAALVYTLYGVLAPIILSIIFSIFGMIYIEINWSENNLQIEKKSIAKCYSEAFKELGKREVLTVGMCESLTNGVQSLFLFLWTPILLASTPTQVNIGFVFLCIVSSIFCGTKVFEISIIYLKLNKYLVLSLCLFVIFSSLLTIFYVDVFVIRLVLFALMNGLSGLYQPLYSIIKYRILEEKHRTLLMNLFRIPLNAYVITILLLLKFINPFTVSLCFIK